MDVLSEKDFLNLCYVNNVGVYSYNGEKGQISLNNIDYDAFIKLAKASNSSIFYYIKTFDKQEEVLELDEAILNVFPKDILDMIKDSAGKTSKLRVACILNGTIISMDYIDEEICGLEVLVDEIYSEIEKALNETNKQILEDILTKDSTFKLQTSQIKRMTYVKEKYKEQLDECSFLSQKEAQVFLDNLYAKIK